MKAGIEPQRVEIAPIELLKRSMDLMGDQYLLFVAMTFVGLFLSNIVPIVLIGPLTCGLYLCFLNRARGETVSFEMMFRGFDYFLESLIAVLLGTVAQVIVIVPAYLIIALGIVGAFAGGGGVLSIVSGIAAFFCYLLVLLLALCIPALLMFVAPLIVDQKMDAITAIKTSYRAAMANLAGILILAVMYGIISAAASCACAIPAFFFAPIAIGATAVLYMDVFAEARGEVRGER